MPKFRKKPIVIEAVQWTGTNITEIMLLNKKGSREIAEDFALGGLTIVTLEGDMYANEGDWIIKGIKDEIYPCKPDIFEATYEIIE